jgi:hypothetical protein
MTLYHGELHHQVSLWLLYVDHTIHIHFKTKLDEEPYTIVHMV